LLKIGAALALSAKSGARKNMEVEIHE